MQRTWPGGEPSHQPLAWGSELGAATAKVVRATIMVEIAARSFIFAVVVALYGEGRRACEINSCSFELFEEAMKPFLSLSLGV